MRWLLALGFVLLGIWVGLNFRHQSPSPENQAKESEVQLSPTPPGGELKSPLDVAAADVRRARLESARKRLEELQKKRVALEEKLREDSRGELEKKRGELERLQVKLKARSGIGEKENSTDNNSEEAAWRDQRAQELVQLNLQLSELEGRLHQAKEEKRRNPSGELETALASLRAEHKVLLTRRDQVKFELRAASSNPKKMSSKERFERKQWRSELFRQINALKFEIEALENRMGPGASARRNLLESRIVELDLKIKELERLIEEMER